MRGLTKAAFVGAVIIAVVIAVQFFYTSAPPSLTSSSQPGGAQQVAHGDVPFTWNETFTPVEGVDPFTGKGIPAVSVTLLNISYVGASGGQGEHFTYRVYYAVKYLMDKGWISNATVRTPHFQLSTDMRKYYSAVTGTLFRLNEFSPGQAKTGYAVFETPRGELPNEVVVYDAAGTQSLYPIYVYEIQWGLGAP